MPFNKFMDHWFAAGRGDISAQLAKSDKQILHEETEIMTTVFPNQDGLEAQDHGNTPIYITGSSPVHTGRGLGRGHDGPVTAKD